MTTLTLTLTLMYSPAPRVVHESTVVLGPGATVMQVIQASGLCQAYPEIDLTQTEQFAVSVWGRRARLTQTVQDLDRVEICRALTVDPKVARRERFAKQGSRGAGLFSKRRPGAKPGY